MTRLTGVDTGFLYGETTAWPMHVGALLVLDPSTRRGPLGIDELRAFVAERLPLMEPFHRRPAFVPLGLDRPAWEDVPDVDLHHHVRRVGVAEPGGPRELAEALALPFAAHLDPRRPLWEAWLAEGLEDGRVALLLKLHHALAGGFTGLGVVEHLLDLEPDPPTAGAARLPIYRSAPAAPERLGRAALSLAALPLRVVRATPGLARVALGLARFRLSRDWGPATLPFQAPRASFNGSLTPDRAIAFASVRLKDVKRVRRSAGVTVNDVVLALCSGALRHYLHERGELPERPLVAQVPVAVHTREGGGPKAVVGNQLSVMGASLATDVEDPLARLQGIRAGTDSGKHLQRALGDDVVADTLDLVPPFLLAGAVRLYEAFRLDDHHPPIFSLIVSDVPGPQESLYTAGARVEHLYPLGPLLLGSGVNITVFSYAGSVDFGVSACPDLLPDPWAVADHIAPALDELLTATGARPAARPRKATKKTRVAAAADDSDRRPPRRPAGGHAPVAAEEEEPWQPSS